MKHILRRLRAALTRHPFSAQSVDAFLADGRGIVDLPAEGSTLSDSERVELDIRMSKLATPIMHTGLLADAISDGDHPVMRDEVMVSPTGAIIVGGAS